jgi:hypothetical protein
MERMVTDTAKTFVDWIKLSPRYLLPICIFTGFVVFAPPNVLSIFGLTGFVSTYRAYFGSAFLLSAALVVSSVCIAFYEWLKRKHRERVTREHRHQRLRQLTEDEKAILRGYIEGQRRTQILSMSDGTVGQFVVEKILFRASKLGSVADYFPYNIQPWAWEYLNKHPELLEPASPPPDHGDQSNFA